jgi:hypothetical protein
VLRAYPSGCPAGYRRRCAASSNRLFFCRLREFIEFFISGWTPKNTPSREWLLPDVIGCRFIPIHLPHSCSFLQEIHMDGVIRKHNSTLSSLLQYACPKQNMNIAVNRADVAFRPTSYLANSHRSMASHP